MTLLPGLNLVQLAKVERNTTGGLKVVWGRVYRTNCGSCELTWGTKTN